MRSFSREDLQKFGCLKKNCDSTFWKVNKATNTQLAADSPYKNFTSIMFNFHNLVPVTVVKHSMSYKFVNFIADFGGYLGLLLGASLLTIFDMGVLVGGKIFSRKSYDM